MTLKDRSKSPFERYPIVVRYTEQSQFTETYGFSGAQGLVALEGQLLKQAESNSKTVFIFMHPSSTLHLLPMPTAMAKQGFDVLCAASRYPKNDSALIMEKVALDMGAWVRWSREQAGYDKVVLVGWSGGGSLSLFYQAQAENPTITVTPAGDTVDLTSANLLTADGLIFIAAHLSRAETLTEWLDPSITDERNPDIRNPELDIYSPDCPVKPPFTPDFITRFRQAQIDRNRRITESCQDLIGELQRRDTAEIERSFVVHRTMCDPRWIDKTIDPNGRKENWCYLGDPRTVNVGPAGLARYSSLRSWLSQWSFDLSNARGPLNARKIMRTPVLQIVNQADDAVPATHNPIIRDALATTNKTYCEISGATHYYLNQPNHLHQCIQHVQEWAQKNHLLSEIQ